MGGLTSKRFRETRDKLSAEFGIDASEHNYFTGRNDRLDETLATQALLKNEAMFKNFFYHKTYREVMREITYEKLMVVMCYMGYGSTTIHTKRPDLEILALIIHGLWHLSQQETPGETLIEERENNREDEVLFRLVRPFFCHVYTEGFVALLGIKFCQDYWKREWPLMENTLAALYRYIPRGRKASPYAIKLLYALNAVAQVGLQGQSILSTMVGTIQQHLLQVGTSKRLTPYVPSLMERKYRLAKPNSSASIHEDRPVAFDDFSCFQMHLPSRNAERVFKDFVELASGQIFERFDYFFQRLVTGIRFATFIANPCLKESRAREKRNEIYEKLLGNGDPWSYTSWNVKRSLKRKLCDPELGWKACMLINDYISGTINCPDDAVVSQVWKKVKNTPGFTVCKMINRMATSSRELVCVGHLNLRPPANFNFNYNSEGKMDIDIFLVTIRIRHNLPILEDYDHFDHLRKNHLLSSLWSPEQLFTPHLCKLEERAKKKMFGPVPSKKLEARRFSMPEMFMNLPGKPCPKNHPLQRIPVSYPDHTCAGCARTLKLRAIMQICVECQWQLCISCFRRRDASKSARIKSDSHSVGALRLPTRSTPQYFEQMDSASEFESRSAEKSQVHELEVQLKKVKGTLNSKEEQIRILQKTIANLELGKPMRRKKNRGLPLKARKNSIPQSEFSVPPVFKPDRTFTTIALQDFKSSSEDMKVEEFANYERRQRLESDSLIHMVRFSESDMSVLNMPQTFNDNKSDEFPEVILYREYPKRGSEV